MKNSNSRYSLRIAVIGAAECNRDILEMAHKVGYLIAQNGWILITGGRTGVMEAASRGAYESNGIVVGILPGTSPEEANPYVTVPLATGLGHARNAVITQSADAVIAIAGGFGTLSEIALALKMKKCVLGIHTWSSIPGLRIVDSPQDAISEISAL